MGGYVFVENSNKPTREKAKSRDKIILDNVSRPWLAEALRLGYEVYYGVNRDEPEQLECDLPVKLYDSHTYRSLTAFSDNWTAYKNLMAILKQGNIEVIHCNTPIGGIIGRICGKIAKVPCVIYTAHGFHFYKGASIFNNTILKWAEMIMAHWTDAVITMNEEDYQSAQKFNLRKNGKVFKVHGVGITLSDFDNISVDLKKKRTELGLKSSDIVCISAGDLVQRKNYGIAIKAIAKANDKSIHYLICGNGPEKKKLEKIAFENGVMDNVHFLGFRSDVKELMKMSDIFLFTTLQEGMPRAMMEAMACGLPCIASKIRGNVDLLDDGKGGYLCECNNENEIVGKIKKMADSKELRNKMKLYNLEAIKAYDVSVVEEEAVKIYKEVLGAR